MEKGQGRQTREFPEQDKTPSAECVRDGDENGLESGPKRISPGTDKQ